MAKKGGIFQAFRTLFRVVIFGLAGVLAFAVYLNWQGGEDVAAVVPEETQVEEALEAADAGDVVSDAVEEQLEAATDTELPDTGPLVDDVIEEIAAETGDAVDESVVEAVEESIAQATDVASDAIEAVDETVAEVTDAMETPVTMIAIPGSEDTFTLVNAFRRDTGAIEVTTEQTAGGTGATLWLVKCAPLAVGTIATGETAGALGARTEDPEMTEILLSDARAMIAATACGVMR